MFLQLIIVRPKIPPQLSMGLYNSISKLYVLKTKMRNKPLNHIVIRIINYIQFCANNRMRSTSSLLPTGYTRAIWMRACSACI